MSSAILELDEALALIAQHPDEAHFGEPQAEDRIVSAELALAIRFPPSYRRFLAALGCGSFRGREFYGIARDDGLTAKSAVPSAVGVTLRARARASLPSELVIVYATGYGPRFAIDTSTRDSMGECPIMEWRHVSEPREEFASNFGSLFLQLVLEALEDASIDGDDTAAE